VLELSTCSSEK